MSYYPPGQPPTAAPYYAAGPPTRHAQQQAATAENGYLPPPPGPSPSPGRIGTSAPPLPPRPAGGPSRLAVACNTAFPPPPRSPNRPPDLPPRPQQGSRPQTYALPAYTPSYAPPDYGQPPSTQATTQTQPAYLPYRPAYPQEAYSSTATSGTNSYAYSLVSWPAPAPTAYHDLQPPGTSYPQALPAQSPGPAAYTSPIPVTTAPSTTQPQPPTQQVAADEYPTYEPNPPVSSPPIAELETHAAPAPELPLQDRHTQEAPAIVAGSLASSASPVTEVDDLFSSMTISAQQPQEPQQQPTLESHTKAQPRTGSPSLAETHNLLLGTTGPQNISTSLGTSQAPPSALTDCFAFPVKLATTWYVHPQAPDGIVCSKCYVDHIWPTSFRGQFQPKFWSDRTPRRCRFNCPRITEILFPDAVATGSLQPTLDFLTKRFSILDCAGSRGARGGQQIRWFRPAYNALEGMVVCEACYEDCIGGTSLAPYFEPTPAQPDAEVWVCDMSVPYIRKEFAERQKTGDWPTFLYEAKARMGMLKCSKNAPVLFCSRKWFVPVQGPPDALICVACYCDNILKSGDEDQWQQASEVFGSTPPAPTCLLGRYNITVAMSCADEQKNRSIFWRALRAVAFDEPFCGPDGTKTAHWYSLPSQPEGFRVCGACRVSVLESLGVAEYFVPAARPPGPDEAAWCAMNTKAPRFADYTERLLELYFTRNVAPLDAYAVKYGGIPRCPRDVDVGGRSDWYGWPDCVVCAECYVDFVQGTVLDTPDAMPLRGVALPTAQICDMYSPRMRGLYTEACARRPPDASALRAYAAKRRAVYWQTMPLCRLMLAQQQFLATQANLSHMQSVVFTGFGNLEAITNDQTVTYSHSELGGGEFHNYLQVEGARQGQEANILSMQASDPSKVATVGVLESQWRAVE
ncbi:hypothetical protein SPI_06575 [Niveomyces insectorum RCEF 264]|uniref:Integral membrane protein n=1 Tax=Niveomyces insectorum RCEF 264 TaxID=1081102 RepID=A0A167RDY5_9HYPO|nr:hypothetical protein SPI_06575 [Niveomyces insectorum RCEF 264]